MLALNPSGKVPVFKDGDLVLTDSTAIMTYLADKHGGLTHAAGTPDRARQDALTHCILDEIDAVLWTAARHSFILPKEQRVADVKPSLMWEYAHNIERLMNRLEGPYLMGDNLHDCRHHPHPLRKLGQGCGLSHRQRGLCNLHAQLPEPSGLSEADRQVGKPAIDASRATHQSGGIEYTISQRSSE